MRTNRWVPKGYVSADKTENRFKIMVRFSEEDKRYYVADLDKVLEVVTGTKVTCTILGVE